MLGHKWEKAQGTIVEMSGPPAGAWQRPGSTGKPERRYVVELTGPGRQPVRMTLEDQSGFAFPVGSLVHLEVHSKTGEARIDQTANDMTRLQMEQDMAHFAGGDAGGSAGTRTGGGATGQITVNGQPVQLTDAQRAELHGLLGAMRSATHERDKAEARRRYHAYLDTLRTSSPPAGPANWG